VSVEDRPHGAAVAIGGRWIGRGLPVYLVAAAGSRHGGDIQLGFKLIETAGAAGADAILLQRGGLSEREVKSLFGHARHVGITALGMPSDDDDIDLLVSLDVPGLRLRCGGTRNRPLIERAARAGRPLLLCVEPGIPAMDAAAELRERAGSAEVAILAEGEPELLVGLATGFPANPIGYAHGGDDGALGTALALGASLIEAPHDLSGSVLRATATRLRAARGGADGLGGLAHETLR
jgi:sialic acid synthase SpsE